MSQINRNFPTKLKIGAHSYSVEYVKVPKGIDSVNVGLCDKERGIITIDNSLIPSEKYVALWHEIFHILNGELPEREVDWLAQQIAQVLDDNHL